MSSSDNNVEQKITDKKNIDLQPCTFDVASGALTSDHGVKMSDTDTW